jgi:acyl dehydratase
VGPLPAVGTTVTFAKTVSESDVYLFAGITGDLSRNHVDEAYMATTPYGGRIAHGMLVLSYASTTSTMIQSIAGRDCVSYGYDRVRFTGAVRIGDTIRVTYTITSSSTSRAACGILTSGRGDNQPLQPGCFVIRMA